MRWLRSKKATDDMIEDKIEEEKTIDQVDLDPTDLTPEQTALLKAQGGETDSKKVSSTSTLHVHVHKSKLMISTVPQLWRYATPFEKLVNILALFAAVAAGIAQPALTIAFGGASALYRMIDVSSPSSRSDRCFRFLLVWPTRQYSRTATTESAR